MDIYESAQTIKLTQTERILQIISELIRKTVLAPKNASDEFPDDQKHINNKLIPPET